LDAEEKLQTVIPDNTVYGHGLPAQLRWVTGRQSFRDSEDF
jgi:hypothetical protein